MWVVPRAAGVFVPNTNKIMPPLRNLLFEKLSFEDNVGCMELMLELLLRQSQELLDHLRKNRKQQEAMRGAEVARGTGPPGEQGVARRI